MVTSDLRKEKKIHWRNMFWLKHSYLQLTNCERYVLTQFWINLLSDIKKSIQRYSRLIANILGLSYLLSFEFAAFSIKFIAISILAYQHQFFFHDRLQFFILDLWNFDEFHPRCFHIIVFTWLVPIYSASLDQYWLMKK